MKILGTTGAIQNKAADIIWTSKGRRGHCVPRDDQFGRPKSIIGGWHHSSSYSSSTFPPPSDSSLCQH